MLNIVFGLASELEPPGSSLKVHDNPRLYNRLSSQGKSSKLWDLVEAQEVIADPKILDDVQDVNYPAEFWPAFSLKAWQQTSGIL